MRASRASCALSVMRLRRRLAIERHPDNELSLGAMAVLGALYRQDGQTVGELARGEKVQPPSMTRTVNCLVDEDGYVAPPPPRHRRPPGRGRTPLRRGAARPSSPTGAAATPGSPSGSPTSPRRSATSLRARRPAADRLANAD